MSDRLFCYFCRLCALLGPIILLAFLLRLSINSIDTWKTFGIGFLWSSDWDPVAQKFGAASAILGTLLTTVIALVVAVPLAFVTAYYLVDAPNWIGKPLSQALDLLAAIPSVIYGMWGLFVFVPLMQNMIAPFLRNYCGLRFLPFFSENSSGFGLLTAGLVLALMILPYISSIMRDVFCMTPSLLREAAYGIGCTRWEIARHITLRYGWRGVLGGIFIGLGRALGETMAVLFVIGNVIEIPTSFFASGTTISATLANNFAEADGLMQSVLFALALILLLLALAVQIIVQQLVKESVN
ncbi:MAG: phosphate ABC transporter permease subunit PstC [Thermoguttaceae bacterium]